MSELGKCDRCGTEAPYSWRGWEHSTTACRKALLTQLAAKDAEIARLNAEAMGQSDLIARLQAQLTEAEKRAAALEAALKSMVRCKCTKIPSRICPQCDGPLEAVTYRGGPLNEDQFMAVRAGDFYCKSCNGTEAATGFKYWWVAGLQSEAVTCGRCAALSGGTSALDKLLADARREGAAEAQAELDRSLRQISPPVRHWKCVECSCIQVGSEYPDGSCRCGATDFIADDLEPRYRKKAVASCDHLEQQNGFCPTCGHVAALRGIK